MAGKVAVAGISLILVVGVVIAVIATVSHNSSKASNTKTTAGMKAVDTVCGPTDYKDLCKDSLGPVANKEKATPKDIVEAIFNSTMNEVDKVMGNTEKLGANLKSDYDKMAWENCKDLLKDAIYDLELAVKKVVDTEVNGMGEIIADLNNWFSSVIAYKQTCLDDLENPEMKKAMQEGLMNTTHLSYNGLAIIEEIGNVLNKFNISSILNQQKAAGRKLLGDDGYPTWLSSKDRKLLADQPKPDAVVAQDGSGQFKSINDAIAAIPKNRPAGARYVIYVKAGIYKEYVLIPKKVDNVYMYGDGHMKTVVTGNKNFAIANIPTSKTATFDVQGNGFIAKDMAFENTAGPEGHQAVALLTKSDMSVYFNCRFDGYQDTLYYNAERSFFRDCIVSGTVDFIFGRGSAIIQNSELILRMPLPNQFNALTADGRENPRMTTGLVIQNCRIVAEPKLDKVKIKSYLGRPWGEFARAVIMESEITDAIVPEGWNKWNDNVKYEETCEFREFANRGPGANTAGRAKYRGIQVITDRKVAEQYTVVPFLFGDKWIADAGVPAQLGLAA